MTSFFIFSSLHVLCQLRKGKIDKHLVSVNVLLIVGIVYMCMHINNDIRSLYARNVFDYLISVMVK